MLMFKRDLKHQNKTKLFRSIKNKEMDIIYQINVFKKELDVIILVFQKYNSK